MLPNLVPRQPIRVLPKFPGAFICRCITHGIAKDDIEEKIKHQLQLRRVMARWSRYDLIAIDDVGYVRLAEVGAEFLFQLVAERTEKSAVILTTNLPFSEWTQVIPLYKGEA
jgi:DNA replication protein DnaC